MFLHIGKDYMLKTSDIIGIFNIDVLKKTNEYDKIMENIEIVEKISEDKEKTLILVSNNKAYISNILSTTIANRNTILN